MKQIRTKIRIGRKYIMCLLAIVLSLTCSSAHSEGKPTGEPERLANEFPDYHQYEAQIVKVKDADTIRVKLHLLPGLVYKIDVRSKGVDAPELKGKCDWEKKLAEEAKHKVSLAFKVDEWVYIENIEPDAFGGRIVGDIKQRYGNQTWRTVTDFLLQKEGRWGVKYVKGQKKFNWCRDLE